VGLGYNLYTNAFYEGQHTDRNNLSPFGSFALGLTKSEAVILRGGAGINYAPPTRTANGKFKATPFYPAASGFAPIAELVGSRIPRGWLSSPNAVEVESYFSKDIRTAFNRTAFLATQYSIGNLFVVETGYHLTSGRNLVEVRRPLRPLSTGGQAAAETEDVMLITSDGASDYHSLQVRVTSRERRQMVFQAHYTLSKSIDTSSDDTPNIYRSLAIGPVDENNPVLERGLSDFDRRHRIAGFFVWQPPIPDGWDRTVRAIIGNWQMSGVITYQSGPYVSIYSSGDYAGGRGDFNQDGVLNDRLSFVGWGSVTGGLSPGSSPADSYLDPAFFTTNGVALGRNILPAPAYLSLDIAIQKKLPLTEEHSVEVRAEAYNLANRVNFAPPVTDFVSLDFGRSREAAAPRTVRFLLRYSF
jgi:hypothetical protein